MFAIERAFTLGPRGGRVPGFCIAWRGAGRPTGGRSVRSGWYKFRSDAERVCQLANEHFREIASKPEREAVQIGMPSFVAKLIDPAGRVRWLGHAGETADGLEAFRYTNADAAWRSAANLFGHGPAFWNSERESQARLREAFRGWRFEVIADADLPAQNVGG